MGLLHNALKPGAQSTHITIGSEPSDRTEEASVRRPDSRSSCRSLPMKDVSVKDETVSLSTRMSCRQRRITSAANDEPIEVGGSDDDCSLNCFGNDFKDEHWWQCATTVLMALSISRA